jgi:hypothetical protein
LHVVGLLSDAGGHDHLALADRPDESGL